MSGLGCQGSDGSPPGAAWNWTECPQRAGLRVDRMSGEARWVSPEQALCPAEADRMSLAEWYVCTRPRLVQLRVQWGSLWWVAPNADSHFANYFLLLGAAGWG